ncbi:hypothetical protein RIF29_28466 [Crotalaria pallida]|uniref:Uncharacterized protein n=1 Tax=Crotalaria pallida TaxID=3830 RepID=A0AAN9EDQ2_CROPI
MRKRVRPSILCSNSGRRNSMFKISETRKRMTSFRDKSINKWQRMTQVTTGAAIKGKLNAFNQVNFYNWTKDSACDSLVPEAKDDFKEIFGGVGIACLPLGLLFSFIRRPKVVITRSQYIKEATELGKKAKELKKAAASLHHEERSDSKGRKFRKIVKAVEKDL